MAAAAITLAFLAVGAAITAAMAAFADIATGFRHTALIEKIITPAVFTVLGGCSALFLLIMLFACGVWS